MMLLNYPFELVAPMAAISSILLLLLGPLLIPRFYLVFLLVYFTCFLYSQINHVFKFWITSSAMRRTIRNWNQSQRINNANDKSSASAASSGPASPSPTPTRERYAGIVDDDRLEEMEASLKLYEDSHFVHAFIVPNYAEPEGLLRDTIKRLANHR